MKNDDGNVQLSAVEQFRSASLRAKLEQIRSALTGKSADLLAYEEVREKVHAIETNKRELKMIPLDAIVGSVGRYKDFTRHFFPLVDEDEYRWARVHTLTDSMQGLPPIEVYQIGEAYFVSDGNHRVSVARAMELSHIEAYVTQVETAVPLQADIQPDDLISKERYANFLALTKLDKTYPDLDLSMSVAGNYRVLEQQIWVHQHWVKEHKGEDISFAEAAERWYKWVYWPVIQMIRERGLMRDFPKRTETDLYVWIHEHRHELAEELGWSVDAATAVADLIVTQSKRPQRVLERLSAKVQDIVTPDALEAGPPAGIWRQSQIYEPHENRLFPRILVAVNGKEDGWLAFEQALLVAQHEKARLYGLHVIARKQTDKKLKRAAKAKEEFVQRCVEAGVAGEFSVEKGKVTRIICDRARWTDLVVVSLAHPPGSQPAARLGSQFSQLLRRCPRPVLAVPHSATHFNKLLLAYDGSPKANEALYVVAYLTNQWQLPLTVVTVSDKHTSAAAAVAAREYLEQHNTQANYIHEAGDPAEIILHTAKTEGIDLIIMGGYGRSPLAEVMVGSVVDEVLRTRNRPVLICR